MKPETVKYLKNLGGTKEEIKRIAKWMVKIPEDEFIKQFKEELKNGEEKGLKDKALSNYARRWTRYKFAEKLSTRSQPFKILVFGNSGAFLTKFAKGKLNKDEIKSMKPGEIPEELKGSRDEDKKLKSIWTKSYDIKIMRDDKEIAGRVMMYDENVINELPENSIVEGNFNLGKDGITLNWAKDTKDSIKVVEKDIDVYKHIEATQGIVVYDSGKFTSRDLRRIDILINENKDWNSPAMKKSMIWQRNDFADVEIPPALTPIEFAAIKGSGGTFNNISKFRLLDNNIDIEEIASFVPLFDLYDTMKEWFDGIESKTRRIRNDSREFIIAEEQVAGSSQAVPMYCIIQGAVTNINLEPHEKTGNCWLLLDVEGEEIDKQIMCFIPGELIKNDNLGIMDEVRIVVQLQYCEEEDRFSANAGGIVKIGGKNIEKPKEIKPLKEESEKETPEEAKKEEEKKEESSEERDLDEMFDEF